MTKPSTPSPEDPKRDPKLPIGQEEGEGTNAVQHQPNPDAEPMADGDRKYIPRTGYNHGNQ